ncbi:hypothetical protein PRIPAC_84725 [Pristionchus pacificus]|uniref:Uncharacterized protein n=1 Tax=Pristionchus pacificus TaxID=54126 RepID=A0A2A6BTG2_PRIPA|nr:hypothetical protein PRIPAC_84725 [Pristionchus pacificus]|eukprot:PDM69219.1 hypothetical protein PRIPAC_47521 [Pristionchus pacificus]
MLEWKEKFEIASRMSREAELRMENAEKMLESTTASMMDHNISRLLFSRCRNCISSRRSGRIRGPMGGQDNLRFVHTPIL